MPHVAVQRSLLLVSPGADTWLLLLPQVFYKLRDKVFMVDLVRHIMAIGDKFIVHNFTDFIFYNSNNLWSIF